VSQMFGEIMTAATKTSERIVSLQQRVANANAQIPELEQTCALTLLSLYFTSLSHSSFNLSFLFLPLPPLSPPLPSSPFLSSPPFFPRSLLPSPLPPLFPPLPSSPFLSSP